jgi:NDP-sugar pyrophosphorylase family protein
MKAMVLAAGVGSRLDPLTSDIPKPLVPVANFPVMQHILQLLHRHKFHSVAANLHYLPQKLIEYFGNGSQFDLDLHFRQEEKLSGDAGGVRFCRDLLEGDTFVVLMGDLLTDVDLTYVVAQHKAKKALASIALKKMDDVSRFGVALLNQDGFIQGFQEKPSKEEALSDLISTGIYVFEPEVFDYIPKTGEYGFGRQLFPQLVQAGLPVLGVEIGSYWSDVGTIEQYWASNLEVLSGKLKVDLPGYKHTEQDGHSVYIAEGARLDPSVSLEGNLMLGRGAQVGSGSRLIGNVIVGDGGIIEAGCEIKESVLWRSVRVSAGTKLENAVVANCGVVNVFDHPKSVKSGLSSRPSHAHTGADAATAKAKKDPTLKTQAPLQVGACV